MCTCAAEEIVKTYPSYKLANEAMRASNGLPENLKPKMQACAQKVFAEGISPIITDSSATNVDSKWSTKEQSEYTVMCRSSLKEKGRDNETVNNICNCATTEAQKIYLTYAELEKAFVAAKGMPEALKSGMISCANKV